MSALQDLLDDKYLFRDILRVYVGILKEKKGLHELNCPDCERKEKPCRKYFWLFQDIQEIGWKIKKLDQELKEVTL